MKASRLKKCLLCCHDLLVFVGFIKLLQGPGVSLNTVSDYAQGYWEKQDADYDKRCLAGFHTFEKLSSIASY